MRMRPLFRFQADLLIDLVTGLPNLTALKRQELRLNSSYRRTG